jgi:hypothetical protein
LPGHYAIAEKLIENCTQSNRTKRHTNRRSLRLAPIEEWLLCLFLRYLLSFEGSEQDSAKEAKIQGTIDRARSDGAGTGDTSYILPIQKTANGPQYCPNKI